MFFIGLLFCTAFALSSIAAYYSIVGLIAIFSSAPISIAIMGGSLEVAKLVTVSWLYRNWQDAPKILKYYFTIAVVVLVLITSLGIFGYLSKAHNDQNLVSGDVQSKIAIYDEKIKTEKENIETNRKILKQMDDGVDQVLGRSTTETGAEKAVAIRKSQQKERSRIQNEISQSQKSIAELNDARAPIASEVRKVEAEVGPIKYIAALIYGDSIDSNILDKSVRFVIILLVLVFDPMAVLLIIAGNYNLNLLRKPHKFASEPQMTESKINMTSIDPIPMNKDEITNATTLYHKEEVSKKSEFSTTQNYPL